MRGERNWIGQAIWERVWLACEEKGQGNRSTTVATMAALRRDVNNAPA